MSGAYQPSERDILWDVERRHLEEAEFVLGLWEDAFDAPDYTLVELARGPEQRLLAHVDALAVGGEIVAQRLLAPVIEDASAYGERVTAAVLACESPELALEVLPRASEDDHVRGLVRGLELREDPQLDAHLLDMLREDAPPPAALLELLARRKVSLAPWPGWMREASEQAALARPIARLARWSADRRALENLDVLARSDHPFLRAAALQTALQREMMGAWESICHWALTEHASPGRRGALEWVACLGDAAARARVVELIDEPRHRVSALWASSFGGSIAAVERCLPLLEDEDVGPLAAELVCAIAGLSTEDRRYWLEPEAPPGPELSLPPLSSEELEADLSLSPESLLPRPDPEAIRAWWRAEASKFEPDQRYLYGRPLSAATLLDALEHAPLRRRHVLARELAVRSNGALELCTRALAVAQQRALAKLPSEPQWRALDLHRERRAM